MNDNFISGDDKWDWYHKLNPPLAAPLAAPHAAPLSAPLVSLLDEVLAPLSPEARAAVKERVQREVLLRTAGHLDDMADELSSLRLNMKALNFTSHCHQRERDSLMHLCRETLRVDVGFDKNGKAYIKGNLI